MGDQFVLVDISVEIAPLQYALECCSGFAAVCRKSDRKRDKIPRKSTLFDISLLRSPIVSRMMLFIIFDYTSRVVVCHTLSNPDKLNLRHFESSLSIPIPFHPRILYRPTQIVNVPTLPYQV